MTTLHDSPVRPPARLRHPRPLFIGIPGIVADALCRFIGTTGLMPLVTDRADVDLMDTRSDCYRPLHVGRPRLACLMHSLAAQVPEVLSDGGYRPEDPYIAAACSGGVGRSDPATGVSDLVTRPDVVVLTHWTGQEFEWDLPIAPDVPCLQLLRDEFGRTWAGQRSTWARRRCHDCVREAHRHGRALGLGTPLSAGDVLALMYGAAFSARDRFRCSEAAWPDCVCALGGIEEIYL